MSARILAAVLGGLLCVLRAHFTVRSSGLSVTVYVPWFLAAATALAALTVAVLLVRHLHSIRSSPYWRPVRST